MTERHEICLKKCQSVPTSVDVGSVLICADDLGDLWKLSAGEEAVKLQEYLSPMLDITHAPTNATTAISSLTALTALITEVNAANQRANDLAGKFNTLVTQLKSQGLMQ